MLAPGTAVLRGCWQSHRLGAGQENATEVGNEKVALILMSGHIWSVVFSSALHCSRNTRSSWRGSSGGHKHDEGSGVCGSSPAAFWEGLNSGDKNPGGEVPLIRVWISCKIPEVMLEKHNCLK